MEDTNPYRPPLENSMETRAEARNKRYGFREYHEVEKTDPVPCTFGVREAISEWFELFKARSGEFIKTGLCFGLGTFPFGLLFFLSYITLAVASISEEDPLLYVIVPLFIFLLLLFILSCIWMLPGCLRHSLHLMRGNEPDYPSIFSGGRFMFRTYGLIFVFFPALFVPPVLLGIPVVFIFEACVGSYKFGFFVSGITLFILYQLLAIAYFFCIFGTFVNSLFFMVDRDISMFESIREAWVFGRKNRKRLTLIFFVQILLFYACAIFTCDTGIFWLCPVVFCTMQGMIYLKITGQKHCLSIRNEQNDEW